MTKSPFYVLLALAATTAARAGAQIVDKSNGEAGGTILQLTTVPRAAALGGALVAADGIGSLFANPAGIASLTGTALHASGQSLFDGAKAGSAAVGFRRPSLALAVGARYLDLGSVDEVVCNGCGGRGTATGVTLSAHELAATGAAALALGRVAVGAAVNYYSTTVAEASGSSISFSGGARIPARAGAPITLGASVQFVGGNVSLAGFSSPLPTTVRVGAELRPFRHGGSFHLALAGDYVAVRGAPGRIEGGAELGIVPPSGGFGLVGRLGYASGSDADYATKAITFGGGLMLGRFSLDYAYQNSTALGAMQRIGVTAGR